MDGKKLYETMLAKMPPSVNPKPAGLTRVHVFARSSTLNSFISFISLNLTCCFHSLIGSFRQGSTLVFRVTSSIYP